MIDADSRGVHPNERGLLDILREVRAATGKADLVSMARPLLADAAFAACTNERAASSGDAA